LLKNVLHMYFHNGIMHHDSVLMFHLSNNSLTKFFLYILYLRTMNTLASKCPTWQGIDWKNILIGSPAVPCRTIAFYMLHRSKRKNLLMSCNMIASICSTFPIMYWEMYFLCDFTVVPRGMVVFNCPTRE
jgi:hypothetical protein